MYYIYIQLTIISVRESQLQSQQLMRNITLNQRNLMNELFISEFQRLRVDDERKAGVLLVT